MKKISTLAVALMTLGSLVTPAQADVVPTSTLPSGYYKIKSATTEPGTHPNINLFSDYFLESNTNHATLLSSTTKDNNNYIWKITNDGKATIGIVNGQGTPIKRENGNKVSYSYVEHFTLTPFTSKSTFPSSILFKEYLFTPKSAGPDKDQNHQYGDYTAVAYFGGHESGNTKWNLEKVDVDANVYTVSISGGNRSCYVTRTLTDGSEVAFNGGFFVSTTTDAISDDTHAFTASALEDHKSIITINSADKTISVAYTPTLAGLKNLINTAKEVQAIRGVGYPTTTSFNYGALEHAITTAEAVTTEEGVPVAYAALQDQIATYKSNKVGIQMPEDGKVYRIYAKWADGTKVYAVNNGSTTTKNSKYYTSGSKTEPTDNKGLWIVQKVGSNYNFASAVANSLFTYVQGANGDKAQIVDIIPSAGKNLGQICLGANKEGVHIVMNSDASKLDQLTDSYTDSGAWSTQWCFEEVPTSEFAGQTVNFVASTDGKNYATLNLPYASKLPEGVTAYRAGEVVDNDLNITVYKNAGDVLPANTPVLLTATSDGSKTFAPAPYVAAEETGFQGTLSAKAVTATNTYILSKNGGETVKFFALDETNNTINANKAYLVVSAPGAQALNFNFGNTTGIQNAAVEGVNANAPLFDLSGRRVVKAVKGGIYIQNGKKFVK